MTDLCVLLLEDSDLDAELVTQFMALAGLSFEIDRTVTKDAFAAALASKSYDLILADYVLPSFDGLSALAMARETAPATPFVFVSGTLGEDVVVEALKEGATDYVTKQNLDRLPRTILRALAEAKARRERAEAEQALRDLNDRLEQHVAERTRALEEANRELRHQILERERVESVLRRSQRLEAVGQLTSGVAHDFNNLLTVILGSVNFVERFAVEPAARRRLDMMRAAAERGARLTTQLLAFSRRQRLDPRPIDVNQVVGSMRDLLQSSIGGGVQLQTELTAELWPAHVDPTHLELVVLNMAVNARDAMQVGGAITIETANVHVQARSTRPEEPAPGHYVMIAVSDTGSGIAPEVLDRVFEPFFTTKEVGKGSGLGLAQVYGFAQQSGGGVRIETQVGVGTTVRVYLPRASAGAVSPQPSQQRAADASKRGSCVLLVDDDASVREVTASMLVDLGFTVRQADSGQAALNFLREFGDIDVLVVDFAMPGMNGAEAARRARLRRPELPVLFVTGYAETAALKNVGATEDRILQKPFTAEDLARKITGALQAAPS